MNLKLDRPLAFFDLETTGINISKDRIVEISILKVFPNGNKESKTWLVNPEIEIPKEASEVHGITNEKVVSEPTFKELAPKVVEILEGCDLAGFNSDRFDIPLLSEELLRVNVDFDLKQAKTVDVQTIFHTKEQRTLSAGYKFYCGKDLTDAHSAEADTNATFEILEAQLEKYSDLEKDVPSLSEFTTRKKSVDFAGFIVYNEKNEPTFSFGKHKGKTVKFILKNEPGYIGWIQNGEFPLYTKSVLAKLKAEYSEKRNEQKQINFDNKLSKLQEKFNK